MKKLFLILFVTTALAAVFTSCGGDDEPAAPDLTVSDTSILLASSQSPYTGTCTVSITDMTGASKEITTNAQITSSTPSLLLLTTPEFGYVESGDRLRNFAFTSIAKDKITFTMGGFSKTGLTGGYIADYYTAWFKDYKITSMDLILNNTTALFDTTTKVLTFTYNGNIKFTVEGNSVPKTNPVKYVYTLTHP